MIKRKNAQIGRKFLIEKSRTFPEFPPIKMSVPPLGNLLSPPMNNLYPLAYQILVPIISNFKNSVPLCAHTYT